MTVVQVCEHSVITNETIITITNQLPILLPNTDVIIGALYTGSTTAILLGKVGGGFQAPISFPNIIYGMLWYVIVCICFSGFSFQHNSIVLCAWAIHFLVGTIFVFSLGT